MKFVLSKRAKGLLGIFLVISLAALLLVNAAGYLLDIKAINVFAAMAEINKYEIRSRLLMEAMDYVGVCDPEKAVDVWAGGLMQRSAAMQYSVMTKNLKNKYAEQLEETFPNWVTGISSPWIDSYKIIKRESLNENNQSFELLFSTRTSTGPAGDYKANITLEQEGEFWRITKINTDKGLKVYTGFK